MSAASDARLARRMWEGFEPYHAVVYFSPLVREEMEAIGLRGFWRGYFAGRAAPLGPTPAEVVTATFFNFAPAMVERAIPAVWELAEPAAVSAARARGAGAALADLLGPGITEPAIVEAATLARRACEGCRPEGRALYAAHRHLPWPEEPHVALWHAATLLREHRGDTHNAALVAAGVHGCQAHLLACAAGRTTREVTQPARGWTDAEWDRAAGELRERGLLTDDGGLDDLGRQVLAEIDTATDRASMAPWVHLGPEATEQLRLVLDRLGSVVLAADWFPAVTPIGLPAR